MQRVEPLTGKAAREFQKLTDEFVSAAPRVDGNCRDCNKPLQVGFLHYVTKWGTEDRSGMKVLVPVEKQCHACGLAERESGRRKPARRGSQSAQEASEPVKPALTAKEVLVKLYGALSDEPHGSKWLAREADVPYGDHILVLLRRLKDAGKVRLEDGRWARI